MTRSWPERRAAGRTAILWRIWRIRCHFQGLTSLLAAKTRSGPEPDRRRSLGYNTVADLALVVPLPLFDRNQGSIRAAQSELIAAENEVQRVGLDLRNRLAAAFEQ